jgi:hypothetical protein
MLAFSLDWEAVSSVILACALPRSASSFSTRPIRLEITTAPIGTAITSVVSAISVATPEGVFSVATKSHICLLPV